MATKRRTLPKEIERLVVENADTKILQSETVQFLMEELLANELYGEPNSAGEPDIVHVKDDGTFNLKTENINGYDMKRLSNGNVVLRKTDYIQKEIQVYSDSVRFHKKIEEEIVLDQNGNPVIQNWVSQKRHHKLL